MGNWHELSAPERDQARSALIRGELERLLGSAALAPSDRLCQFLRFIVETALREGPEGIKETRIGVQVYGRALGYDPKADSIVRTEARRLRLKLEEYYAGPGQHDRVRITVPTGGYAPQFDIRPEAAPQLEVISEPVPPPPRPARTFRRAWVAIALLIGTCLGMGWFWLRPSFRHREALLPVPFTTLPGREDTPSFSPDGREVAFSWMRPDNPNGDIYRKPLAGGALVRLTQQQNLNFNPVWSPDGRSIAYRQRTSDDRLAIRLVAVNGNGDRKIADTGPFPVGCTTGLSWSKDGQYLFASEVEGGSAGLFRFSVADGSRERMTRVKPGELLDCGPAVSPDGHRLAFARWSRYEISDLFVQELGSDARPRGQPQRVTFGNQRVVSPAWTPDGRHIVYSAGFDDAQLWEINCCGRSEPQLITEAGSDADHPAISSQNMLLFRRQRINVVLRKVSLREDGTADGPATDILGSTRIDNLPDFSPDGRRIAFESNRSGHFEIWTADPDGSDPLQLTDFQGPRTGHPSWSPDGRQIVFHSSLGGQYHLYLIPAKGGPVQPLAKEAEPMQAPRWSPDGVWIYCQCRRGGADRLCRISAQGGAAETVGPAESFLYEPYPTQQGLYWAQGAGEARHLCYLSPATATAPACLSVPMLYSVFAVSAHGRYLAVKTGSTESQIQFVPFTGKASTPITTEHYSIRAMAVSADGRHLLYSILHSWEMNLFRLQLDSR